MNKLDHLIKSIDRLVELNEEMLQEIRGCGTAEFNPSQKLRKSKLDIETLGQLINSNQVMGILNFSKSTLSRNINSKIITPIRIGKRNWFDLSQIEALRNYFLK
ncbi:MAG: hypothetical protein B7X86_07545 [Sphingobacteriales bacterium 17-39-43]|uniref:hypothetical protein n=1 Tax=Daejeonella sp. TaxID=2805397 RepID=UPI000BD85F4C|nr:hypothetical protein [Daejeonella sp.]OYZ31784.1 MAG: hypothetical protein B7Y24_08080 [Sphingobacteriales bacterium 16-39-50]OZA24891.1 MAG: hypothetical protein B7X86_07545 [Sphingobacteriales bacterium 17-39-43]HQS05808.1 hypothetical protein [Daejeonella sp.]HQT22822.1 hypothetical protein [Daejeonella sp.]HQT57069.1 hypothetical protein [Daejeonella sp.]